ncbi:MAG: L-fucose mutarotase [Clostridia bacterium]|nr:L-fucose mutarotase [Clostridia bacterium]
MLKGISPLLSPELIKVLAEMGHGDEIVLADAHFPGHSCNARVLRADGLKIADLLRAIIPIFELDAYAPPVLMMAAVPGDTLDPEVEAAYVRALQTGCAQVPAVTRLERFAFYERTRQAYAVVMTGELAKYGNIILKKGVICAS